jgi:hypothetical protein
MRVSRPNSSLRITAARIASGTIGPQAMIARSSSSDGVVRREHGLEGVHEPLGLAAVADHVGHARLEGRVIVS